jgi:hypothetical protein
MSRYFSACHTMSSRQPVKRKQFLISTRGATREIHQNCRRRRWQHLIQTDELDNSPEGKPQEHGGDDTCRKQRTEGAERWTP